MAMRIGVCCGPENLLVVHDSVACIEPTVGSVLKPKDSDEAFTQELTAARNCPLPMEAANCLFPGDLKTTGPDVDPGRIDDFFRTVARRAGRAGMQVLVFGSAGSRRVPDGFDPSRAFEQLVDHGKRLGPIAAESAITLVIEPLHQAECNIINTVDEGAELVRRIDHPNVRLLIDTYHMAKDDDSPDAIRRAGELIYHAHCADAEGRVPVGLGPSDHRPYFRALKDVGYASRMSIEAKWEDFGVQLPQAAAALEEQIDTA